MRLGIGEVVSNESCRASVTRVIVNRTKPLRKGMTMIANKAYTVSDGEMVLTLEPAEEGGFVVTSPLDPELITEAESLDEAFENARDAADALNESRKRLTKQLADTEQSP